MELYGSLTSPYVRKLRVLLAEKALPHTFHVADAWTAGSPIPSLNPLGKVPAFIADDGQVYFDSPMIAEYIDALSPPHLIPPSGQPRWEVLRWHALAQGLMDVTVTRLLELRRPPAQQSASNASRQEAKISAALAFANRSLSEAPRAWLWGGAMSLGDIALAVALGYIDFRYPHPWRDAFPALATWAAPILSRPSFTATTPPDA